MNIPSDLDMRAVLTMALVECDRRRKVALERIEYCVNHESSAVYLRIWREAYEECFQMCSQISEALHSV